MRGLEGGAREGAAVGRPLAAVGRRLHAGEADDGETVNVCDARTPRNERVEKLNTADQTVDVVGLVSKQSLERESRVAARAVRESRGREAEVSAAYVETEGHVHPDGFLIFRRELRKARANIIRGRDLVSSNALPNE